MMLEWNKKKLGLAEGWTLLELIIVLMIVALGLVGLMNGSKIKLSFSADEQARELVAHLRYLQRINNLKPHLVKITYSPSLNRLDYHVVNRNRLAEQGSPLGKLLCEEEEDFCWKQHNGFELGVKKSNMNVKIDRMMVKQKEIKEVFLDGEGFFKVRQGEQLQVKPIEIHLVDQREREKTVVTLEGRMVR